MAQQTSTWQDFSIKDIPSCLSYTADRISEWKFLGRLQLQPYVCEDGKGQDESIHFGGGFLRMRLAIPAVLGGIGGQQLPTFNVPDIALTAGGVSKAVAVNGGSGLAPRLQILIRVHSGGQLPPYDMVHTLGGAQRAAGIIWGKSVSLYAILFDDSDTLNAPVMDTALWCSFVGIAPGMGAGREFVAVQDVQGAIDENIQTFVEFSPPTAVSAFSICHDITNLAGGQTVEMRLIDEKPGSTIICRRTLLLTDEPKVMVWPTRVELLRFELVGLGPATGLIPINVSWIQGEGFGYG